MPVMQPVIVEVFGLLLAVTLVWPVLLLQVIGWEVGIDGPNHFGFVLLDGFLVDGPICVSYRGTFLLFLAFDGVVVGIDLVPSTQQREAILHKIYYIMATSKELSEQILKLEAEQKQLLQQRKSVLRSLTAIRKSQRYFKSQDDPVSPSKPTGYQLIRKKRKLQDGSEEIVHHIPTQDTPKDKPQPPHPDLKIPQSIQQRNKRIFGALDQHLKKAKIKLESEEEQAKKKAELQQESILSQQQSVRAMKEEKRQVLAKTKEEENKKKDQLAASLLAVENSLLETRFKKYTQRLKGYIPTKTQPVIYWKPLNFNENLTKLLGQSSQHLKAFEEKAVQSIKSITEPIAYSKSEYLANKVARYYKNLEGCILTETKPQIYWRPAKSNEDLKKLETKTVEIHSQKLQQSRQTFVHHPKPQKQPSQEDISESDNEHDSH